MMVDLVDGTYETFETDFIKERIRFRSISISIRAARKIQYFRHTTYRIY